MKPTGSVSGRVSNSRIGSAAYPYTLYGNSGKESQMNKMLLILFFAQLVAIGCAPLNRGVKHQFISSSLDFSSGKPQSITLPRTAPKVAIEKFKAGAEKRGIFIVDSDCSNSATCKAKFKTESKTVSNTSGSGYTPGRDGYEKGHMNVSTVNLSYGSRYYAEAIQQGEDTILNVVGVPTISDQPSCPQYLQSRNACTVEGFWCSGKDFAKCMGGIWGIDLSGKSEYENIRGVFSELGN